MNNRPSRTPTRVHPAQVARGPQSHPIPAQPLPPYPAAHNAALLIDFDNVTMGIRSELASELKNLLSSDVVKGKIAIRRAYADWRRYPQYVLPLTETSIDLIYAPAYGSARKNATDIRLAIDAMELVFTRPEIGTIVLLSGDSDFSSLVIKLKEYGKYVIGVGIRESSSDLLVQNCDEYYSYNALAGLVKTGDEPVEKWDPWELAAESVMRMKRNGDVMRADRLKQVMQEIDSSFDEKNTRHAKFSRFVAEAAQRGILHMTKLDNGQLEIDLPRIAEDAAAPGSAVEDVIAESSADEPAERPPARERGRRDRYGRSRGESRTSRAVAGDNATPSQPAPAPAPASAAAASPASAGERLTRSEAFDLLKRAVDALSGPANNPVPASRVREKAQEILGRESDTLSERHFVRILHDAHNAEIIDLKKRGEEFEVSRAVAAPSVADKMNIAAAAAAKPTAAPAPATPAARPGARSGRAGFGKRLGEAPAHLLNIGVVDSGTSAARTDGKVPVAAAEPSQIEAAPAAPAEEKGTGRGRRGRGPRGKKAAAAVAAGVASSANGDATAGASRTAGRKRARKGAPRRKTAVSADAQEKAPAKRQRKPGNVAASADAG